jgi:lysophospholipase
MAGRDPLKMAFADQLVTSDERRFQRTQDFLAKHPELRLAGPTWGWLEAAYRSIKETSASGYAEKIATPILICGAGKDRIVDTEATARFAAQMPQATYIEFEDAEHEILMENDSVRARFWEAFDAFVGKYV